MSAAPAQLLAGVRILAVEQYGAGPYGTQLLAEMGAEVVKIESAETGGDISRATGPFFLGAGDSEFFQTFSRSKKSIALDLKSKEGRATFERLLHDADAVVNNLRGSAPAKLGITYQALKAIKPSIVCAHLSAYGRDNSREGWPGYDYLMQAECGFLSLTGEPGAVPTRFGLSMVDFMSGSVFAAGILAGIVKARASGEGADVDVSLFDVALHQLSYPAVWYMNEGHEAARQPRGAHPSIAPSQLVRTRDGWGFLMCQTPKFWEIFCDKVGHPELKTDPRFKTTADRHRNLVELTTAVDAIFGEQDTLWWSAYLAGIVPFSAVNDVHMAIENPFVAEIGMVDRIEHPAKPDGLAMLACPIMVDGKRLPARRAPALGEHDAEFGIESGGDADPKLARTG
jgi:crotonobetainyl-CoA:carnitine CoA-transferase CaiB-like acyl-CoA transferase